MNNELNYPSFVNDDANMKRIKYQQTMERSLVEKRRKDIRRRIQQKRKRRKIMITTIAATGVFAITSLAIINGKLHNNQKSKIENTMINIEKIYMDQDSDNLEIIKEYLDLKEEFQKKLDISSLNAQNEINNVIAEFQKSINESTEKSGRRVVSNEEIKKYNYPSRDNNLREPVYYYEFLQISPKYAEEFIEELRVYNISYDEASKIWNEKLSEEERNAIILTSCYDIVKNDIERIGGDINQLNSLVRMLTSNNLYDEYSQNNEETIIKLKEFSSQIKNKLSKIIIESKMGRSIDVEMPVIDDYNHYNSSEMENLIYLDEEIYTSKRGGR